MGGIVNEVFLMMLQKKIITSWLLIYAKKKIGIKRPQGPYFIKFTTETSISLRESYEGAKRLIANLDALSAANTNSANFVLHEITDSCQRLFQRYGIRWNDSGCPFENNCHPFERLELSVQNNCQLRYSSKPLPPVCDEPVKKCETK